MALMAHTTEKDAEKWEFKQATDFMQQKVSILQT